MSCEVLPSIKTDAAVGRKNPLLINDNTNEVEEKEIFVNSIDYDEKKEYENIDEEDEKDKLDHNAEENLTVLHLFFDTCKW